MQTDYRQLRKRVEAVQRELWEIRAALPERGHESPEFAISGQVAAAISWLDEAVRTAENAAVGGKDHSR